MYWRDSMQEVIEADAWGRGQDENCRVVGIMLHGDLIRCFIHHDTSYARQGYAMVDVWNAATQSWNEVHRLAGEQLKSKATDFREKRATVAHFRPDLDRLVYMAQRVLTLV